MQSIAVSESPHTDKHGQHCESARELRRCIEHAAHLLPAQGPITAFVHHNTLHAFEDLPFEQAVVQGGKALGCHPFLPEDRYRQKLARGRIRAADIEAVLIDDLGDRADELLGFLGTRFHLRKVMLEYPLHTGATDELRWVIAETDALREFREETPPSVRDTMVEATRRWVMRDLRNGSQASNRDARLRELVEIAFARFDKRNVEAWGEKTWRWFTLHLLWLVCRNGVSKVKHNPDSPAREIGGASLAGPPGYHGPRVRHRDLLLDATGEDADQLVHGVLIRFTAAFLDQGFSEWPLPNRDAGFYQAFLDYVTQPFGPPERWLIGLSRESKRLRAESVAPIDSVLESVQLLGVEAEEWESFITQSLLALRGYAGMIWQTESRGDRVAHRAPEGSLVEFLAVRLLLERFALAFTARRALGYRGPLSELRQVALARIPAREPNHVEQRTFRIFELAQPLGWHPENLYRLSSDEWSSVVHEVESFSGLERRRIYHLAFERRYRNQTLDAVVAHNAQARSANEGSLDGVAIPALARRASVPKFQIVCCIDEREESFRRHLEELEPDCETFGAAGFFGVAIYYRGAADAHYTPLCPVIIQPQHYVKEAVVYSFEHDERRRRRRRRAIGTVTRRVHVGSRTFAGGWIAAVLGSLASFPLVARILFPRLTAQLRHLFGGVVRPPAVTQLQLERSEETPGSDDGHIGYSVQEMAAIVERLLRDMGLTKDLSRLVVVVGHGSSSLNNPHEAAHDCGACGGGRGGPNARSFAAMANDRRVREMLARNELPIPKDTVFVGAYHNTCDESMSYYDLDRLPSSHKGDLDAARAAIDAARERSAHERCRRFESAELKLTTKAALKHVEGRAEDLSQVRPEYGHATNALCFVGRLAWSKGLFLDRRSFLQSYDPAQDDEERTILTRILQAVIPVCAGINLEYYFSYVDPVGYGCGTKLPHNITSLLGVMNGAASDLRPGLPWQMVEIHEPVRLLFVIETTPAAMLKIIERNAGIARLVHGNWVQLATFKAATREIQRFRNGQFEVYRPENNELPASESSIAWYRGWRDHLGFASITPRGAGSE